MARPAPTASALRTPERGSRQLRSDRPTEDGWFTDGEMMRTTYELRADDDDWSQAGALVRDVWDDAQRERFVHTVAGYLLAQGAAR